MRAEILAALRETDGFVSGQDLCEKFNVSRTAVWKAINQLKKEGYEINAIQNKGYQLTHTPDILSKDELESVIKTTWAGHPVCYFEETESTNVVAKNYGDIEYPHGTLIVADTQKSGRGRKGKVWSSPKGEGIWMSLLLKPDLNPSNASMLTLVTALAVVKAVEEITNLAARIKWPNDIVVNGKKICGILTEMSAQRDYINHLVIGVGVNVHTKEFPEECANIATSIYLESKKEQNRSQLIQAIWKNFEIYYDVFMQTQDFSVLMKEYNAYLINRNEKVKVLDGKDTFEGKAMGINEKGELIVDTWEARRLVFSGEVSVRGVYGYV